MLAGSPSSSATQEPDKAGATPWQPQVPHLQVQAKVVPTRQGFSEMTKRWSPWRAVGSNVLLLMLLRATGFGPPNIQVSISLTCALVPLIN